MGERESVACFPQQLSTEPPSHLDEWTSFNTTTAVFTSHCFHQFFRSFCIGLLLADFFSVIQVLQPLHSTWNRKISHFPSLLCVLLFPKERKGKRKYSFAIHTECTWISCIISVPESVYPCHIIQWEEENKVSHIEFQNKIFLFRHEKEKNKQRKTRRK